MGADNNLINRGFQDNLTGNRMSATSSVLQDKSPDVIPHFNNNSSNLLPSTDHGHHLIANV
jgi:hypothetical protein